MSFWRASRAQDRYADRAQRVQDSRSRPHCAAGPDIEQLVFGTVRNELEGLDYISSGSRLRRAFGGTLFLRSVHEMPGRVQVRLARVLRDGEVWVHSASDPPRLERVTVRPIASIDAVTDSL